MLAEEGFGHCSLWLLRQAAAAAGSGCGAAAAAAAAAQNQVTRCSAAKELHVYFNTIHRFPFQHFQAETVELFMMQGPCSLLFCSSVETRLRFYFPVKPHLQIVL